MKLWLDDVRPPPSKEWLWAKTAEEAIAALSLGIVEICSLDHDLGYQADPNATTDPREPAEIPIEDYYIARSAGEDRDGIAVVRWMVKHEVFPSDITIHSWNPIGAEQMRKCLAEAGVGCVVAPFELPRDRVPLDAD